MKIKLIFTLFFSFLFALNFAQKPENDTIKKWKYEPNFMVGVDVLSAGTSFFSDRKLYQGVISALETANNIDIFPSDLGTKSIEFLFN